MDHVLHCDCHDRRFMTSFAQFTYNAMILPLYSTVVHDTSFLMKCPRNLWPNIFLDCAPFRTASRIFFIPCWMQDLSLLPSWNGLSKDLQLNILKRITGIVSTDNIRHHLSILHVSRNWASLAKQAAETVIIEQAFGSIFLKEAPRLLLLYPNLTTIVLEGLALFELSDDLAEAICRSCPRLATLQLGSNLVMEEEGWINVASKFRSLAQLEVGETPESKDRSSLRNCMWEDEALLACLS